MFRFFSLYPLYYYSLPFCTSAVLFCILSPSSPFHSLSPLSFSSSSILPQFPSTLPPLYHYLLFSFISFLCVCICICACVFFFFFAPPPSPLSILTTWSHSPFFLICNVFKFPFCFRFFLPYFSYDPYSLSFELLFIF